MQYTRQMAKNLRNDVRARSLYSVPMKKLLTFSVLAFLPMVAFALDYTDTTSRYSDSPFSNAERGTISS